jgi:hypothetical protein
MLINCSILIDRSILIDCSISINCSILINYSILINHSILINCLTSKCPFISSRRLFYNHKMKFIGSFPFWCGWEKIQKQIVSERWVEDGLGVVEESIVELGLIVNLDWLLNFDWLFSFNQSFDFGVVFNVDQSFDFNGVFNFNSDLTCLFILKWWIKRKVRWSDKLDFQISDRLTMGEKSERKTNTHSWLDSCFRRSFWRLSQFLEAF